MDGPKPTDKTGAERRQFRRVQLDLPGRLFVPSDLREAHCKISDLSPGGAAIDCELVPEAGSQVVLYVEGFGRLEGSVVRRSEASFSIAFACTVGKRDRIAEQLMHFVNNTLAASSVLRRYERSRSKRAANFTRADGSIVECEVMDASPGGLSLKTDVRPPIGEFILTANTVGRVARHHSEGIGIEFVVQDGSDIILAPLTHS